MTFQQYNQGLDDIYLSNLHWAVSASGANNPKDVVKNTWQHFSSNQLTGWDGKRKFYYYREGGHALKGRVENCLVATSAYATCGNFADLLLESLAINGLAKNVWAVYAKPKSKPGGDVIILVKNWSTKPSTSSPDSDGYLWTFFLYKNKDGKGSMLKFSGSTTPDSEYGQLINDSGISGQNMATPVEKAFTDHTILELPQSITPTGMGRYFDPSYGVVYKNEAEFEKMAIFGYGKIADEQGLPDKIRYLVRKASISENLVFERTIKAY